MPRKPRLHGAEVVPLDSLKPHPRNYRSHPERQLEHLTQSLRDNGVYRNVVIARDGTILAGHGVWEAAGRAGLTELPVVRLPLAPDDPRAIKVLVADNELPLVAEDNDRLLADLLREIGEGAGLVGTGYDEQMLANLVFVTRPEGEIGDFDAAQHWAGLPQHTGVEKPVQVVVSFLSEGDREKFMEAIGATVIQKKTRGTWSLWWPERELEDLSSLEFAAEPQS